MMARANTSLLQSMQQNIPLGIGYYTVPEAARLLKIRPRNINRWLGGYTYTSQGKAGRMPPLWTPEIPTFDGHLELAFRDLIELRFVSAFMAAGLGLKTIRHCLAYARECVHDERPFSTRRFKTDGRTIFLDSLRTTGEPELIDLKRGRYVFATAVERTFKDLDIHEDAVTRWRPFHGKNSIVIDPQRAFGQPIVTEYGVPTIALAEAVKAERSVDRVARLYEMPAAVVRDAVRFEEYLLAA
jgi:uncharacterized protein (DUF433 family)